MNPSRRLAALPVAAIVAVDPWGLAPFGPLKWGLVTVLVLAGVAVLLGPGRSLDLARLPAQDERARQVLAQADGT